jgi:hypothetical protein
MRVQYPAVKLLCGGARTTCSLVLLFIVVAVPAAAITCMVYAAAQLAE